MGKQVKKPSKTVLLVTSSLALLSAFWALPAFAGPEPGDAAFGLSYALVSPDADLDERETAYGLSLEMWGTKHQSFQAGVERTQDLNTTFGFAAAGWNLGPVFVSTGIGYAEEAGLQALVGGGLNLTAKKVNLHVRADYLKDLDEEEAYGSGLWKASGAVRWIF